MKEISFPKISEPLSSQLGKQEHVKVKGPSFEKLFQNSINEVNKLQLQADQAVRQLASGNQENIHETMIAIEKAGISFQLMMQARNKIVRHHTQSPVEAAFRPANKPRLPDIKEPE